MPALRKSNLTVEQLLPIVACAACPLTAWWKLAEMTTSYDARHHIQQHLGHNSNHAEKVKPEFAPYRPMDVMCVLINSQNQLVIDLFVVGCVQKWFRGCRSCLQQIHALLRHNAQSAIPDSEPIKKCVITSLRVTQVSIYNCWVKYEINEIIK